VNQHRFDALAIADTCVDLIVDMGEVTPRFGQVEQWVPDYNLEMGGSNCIFACQAARLGLHTALLGYVGDDAYGQLVLRRLREISVDTTYIQVTSELKTGLGIALNRGGDRAILTYAGTLNAVRPTDVTDEFLQSGGHLHLGSYYLLTNLLSAFPEIVGRARQLGLSVSVDTNWDPDETWDRGLEQVLSQVDLFFPNEQEALAITGASRVDDALSALLERVPIVAVKLGERGVLVGYPGGRDHVPVEPVARPVDTIGAGDSFDAGFVAAWLQGHPPEECAAIGNACGRATLEARGGLLGQLSRDDLPGLVPRNQDTGGEHRD